MVARSLSAGLALRGSLAGTIPAPIGVLPLVLLLLSSTRPASALGAYYGTVTTIAGGGANGVMTGTADGVGTAALFSFPLSVTINSAGVIFVTDCGSHKIRAISLTGVVTTFAGGGTSGMASGFVNGIGSNALFYCNTNFWGISISELGVVLTADAYNNNVRIISSTGTVSTIAGGGSDGTTRGFANGVGTNALFDQPSGIVVNAAGTIFVTDFANNNQVRAISPVGVVTTLAGGGSTGIISGYNNGIGTNALFSSLLSIDTWGSEVYVVDNNKVRTISPAGVVTTFVGGGVTGAMLGITNGVGTNALFNAPYIAVDSTGSIIVADSLNYFVRAISPAGTVTRLAGGSASGGPASGSTDGSGTNMLFTRPTGVAIDSSGNIIIVDSKRVRSLLVTATCPAGSVCVGGVLAACPAGSFCPTNSTTPQPCALGSYAPVTSRGSCLLCAPGTFTSVNGSIFCDSFCPAGTARARFGGTRERAQLSASDSKLSLTNILSHNTLPLGESDCTDCPPGTFSDSDGSSTCTQCSAGTANAASRSTSESACVACEPSKYAPAGSASCSACPLNSYPDSAQASCLVGVTPPSNCANGTFSPSGTTTGACTPCPPGTGSFAGASFACATCPTGSACPGGTSPLPCAAGSYAPVAGRTACLLCPPGAWTAATGASFCDNFCTAGTARAKMGGASAADCGDCPRGTYSDSAGAATCTACAAGTASNATRATSANACSKCPLSTYANVASAACSPCPAGSFPDAEQASCLIGVYTCPSGFAPVSSEAPTSAASCAPLTCPPPLAVTADGRACVGCAANTSGTYPACAPCTSDTVCPGLTAAPLVAGAALSAPSASCAMLTGPRSLAPALSVRALPPGIAWLTGVLSVDNAILSGIVLASLAALLFVAARAFASVAAVADGLLARFDAFALSINGAVDRPLKYKARPIGGTFTLLGAIAFATLALTLILQRAADNVNAQRSVVVLDAGAAAAAAELPVFAAAPWGSGIQVRITASGDGGLCAADAKWTATDAGWTLARVPSCGGGSATSQLVFSCADCVLSATSTLSVSLHYSCQSLRVEAAGMDGAGAVTAFVLPTGETTAAAGSLISAVTWTLPTLLSVVNSSVSPSARGFALTTAVHAVTTRVLTVSGSGLVVVPTAASITITIALPLNTFYAVTVLSEKQSFAALLTSIVGLAGVFGFFGSLLGATDYAVKLAPCTAARRARKARTAIAGLPSEEAVGGGSSGAVAATENPLHAVPHAATWRSATDGEDVWFICVETGATAWVVPEGAVLVD